MTAFRPLTLTFRGSPAGLRIDSSGPTRREVVAIHLSGSRPDLKLAHGGTIPWSYLSESTTIVLKDLDCDNYIYRFIPDEFFQPGAHAHKEELEPASNGRQAGVYEEYARRIIQAMYRGTYFYPKY